MPAPDDLDRLSHAELKGLVVKQWEQTVELQRLVAALRDEIARLKGGPGRPNLKPSGTVALKPSKQAPSPAAHKKLFEPPILGQDVAADQCPCSAPNICVSAVFMDPCGGTLVHRIGRSVARRYVPCS